MPDEASHRIDTTNRHCRYMQCKHICTRTLSMGCWTPVPASPAPAATQAVPTLVPARHGTAGGELNQTVESKPAWSCTARENLV